VATRESPSTASAGARIERIVAEARTNKAQLYAYFGSKEGLFDAIFAGSLERIVTSSRSTPPTSRTGPCGSTTVNLAGPT